MSEASRGIMPMYDKATNLPVLAGGGTPGAATAYFPAPGLTVPGQCMRVSITYSPASGTIFGYKRNGGALCNLAVGGTLVAGATYTFVIAARPGDTLNFQDSVGSAVNELLIEGVHNQQPRAGTG